MIAKSATLIMSPGQYHQREHSCNGTLVSQVDVVYRRFLLTRRREMDEAKERQTSDGDEQMVPATSRPLAVR